MLPVEKRATSRCRHSRRRDNFRKFRQLAPWFIMNHGCQLTVIWFLGKLDATRTMTTITIVIVVFDQNQSHESGYPAAGDQLKTFTSMFQKPVIVVD